jgi:hypothetical protein
VAEGFEAVLDRVPRRRGLREAVNENDPSHRA